MTAFKELLIGGYVLRFWPSDNGWMCGITPQMMEALQQQRAWVGLTDIDYAGLPLEQVGLVRWAEAKLKEKNT
jgi:hypothetical protein